MNEIKIRTSKENYHMVCTEAYDGKTFKITDKYLNVYENGQRIRHIPLTTLIKLELHRIKVNSFIENIGWARTFAVWLVAIDESNDPNALTENEWSMFTMWERNKLDNGMIQQIMHERGI